MTCGGMLPPISFWYPSVPAGRNGNMWYQSCQGDEMDEDEVRERILDAAFAAFVSGGYAATGTAEIAARARVSKRELYARVGNKREILIAGLGRRAKRLHVAKDLPVARDRKTLARVLVSLGAQLVREI